MNRIILLPKHRRDDGLFLLTDPLVLNHLHHILQVSPGSKLKACEINQGLGLAQVKEINDQSVLLDYKPAGEGLKSNVDLLVGLSRPPTCKKLLEHGTSMGLHSFYFFKAALSEKSYLNSKLFQNEAYRQSVQLGLAQSSIYFQEPTVSLSLKVPDLQQFKRHQKFILSLNSEKTFHDYRIKADLPLALAIGPERGWIAEEEQFFQQMDFLPVKISRSTLRVEQAAFSALAQIEMLRLTH